MEDLEEIKGYAKENFVPIVRDKTAEELCRQAGKCQSILEIGTAIGYSGLLMLTCSQANLDTIEKDEGRAHLAQENFKKFDYQARVKLYNEDAFTVLERLAEQNKKYDLIFLDGAKGQYIKYLPLIKRLLYRGGTLFADNINLLGLVKGEEKVPHKYRSMVNNLRKFIKAIESDLDFVCRFYDIDDGFVICKLKA